MLSIKDENEILAYWVVVHTRDLRLVTHTINALANEVYGRQHDRQALKPIHLINFDSLSYVPSAVDGLAIDRSYRGMRRGRKGKTKYPIRR